MNNEIILKEFIERVWNGKDLSSVFAYVNDEYTIYIDTGDPWEGKTLNLEQYKERLNYSFNSFPDMHFDIQTSIADGDYVAITWILTGTNLGKIEKFPPTNKKIKTRGATIYHFKNGKVVGHSQVFDRTTVMKQLGYLK
jgi:steroid delta-isomerase-like uncharacterized protein